MTDALVVVGNLVPSERAFQAAVGRVRESAEMADARSAAGSKPSREMGDGHSGGRWIPRLGHGS